MRIITLLLVVLAFFTSCHNNRVVKNKKKKSIIFVCDNIDSGFIKTVKAFKESIVEQFPHDYNTVNIDIYLASAQYQENSHHSACFTDPILKRKRRPEYDKLLKELEHAVKPAIPYGDKSIINSLSDAFKQINEPDVEYLIVFNSDLLENSGTYSNDMHGNPGWLNCNFRFIDKKGICQPLELEEAEKQLSRTGSPVMRELALNGEYKIELYYISNKTEVNSVDSGCDRKRIITFWQQLFEKAGIKSARNISTIQNVTFF